MKVFVFLFLFVEASLHWKLFGSFFFGQKTEGKENKQHPRTVCVAVRVGVLSTCLCVSVGVCGCMCRCAFSKKREAFFLSMERNLLHKYKVLKLDYNQNLTTSVLGSSFNTQQWVIPLQKVPCKQGSYVL